MFCYIFVFIEMTVVEVFLCLKTFLYSTFTSKEKVTPRRVLHTAQKSFIIFHRFEQVFPYLHTLSDWFAAIE